MRVVLQRVKNCQVTVSGKISGEIGAGILTFLGIGPEDSNEDVRYLVKKTAHLRIFPDDTGKMNLSLLDIGGGMLIVSQFTLYGDCRKGRRPSFTGAAPPEKAEMLYHAFVEEVEKLGIKASTGTFGAMMDVNLVNDGPVTLLLDSKGAF